MHAAGRKNLPYSSRLSSIAGPVSYTHLDVYKRQVPSWMLLYEGPVMLLCENPRRKLTWDCGSSVRSTSLMRRVVSNRLGELSAGIGSGLEDGATNRPRLRSFGSRSYFFSLRSLSLQPRLVYRFRLSTRTLHPLPHPRLLLFRRMSPSLWEPRLARPVPKRFTYQEPNAEHPSQHRGPVQAIGRTRSETRRPE